MDFLCIKPSPTYVKAMQGSYNDTPESTNDHTGTNKMGDVNEIVYLKYIF